MIYFPSFFLLFAKQEYFAARDTVFVQEWQFVQRRSTNFSLRSSCKKIEKFFRAKLDALLHLLHHSHIRIITFISLFTLNFHLQNISFDIVRTKNDELFSFIFNCEF